LRKKRVSVVDALGEDMKTFIYYIAERVPGQQEMQRFAHPIHVGMLSAEHVADAYELVCADLTPTFADHPQALEIRFEEMAPPRSGGAGVWKHHKPIDMDITFTSAD
jgi:hypothetical protein